MPRLNIRAFQDAPLFDIASYARHGPGRRDRLSPSELAQIARTVHRAPEVMVKVLSKCSNDIGAVRRHFDYIGRHGSLELETDDDQRVGGHDAGKQLTEDWDLDLEEDRGQPELAAAYGSKPKLVHKLILSMPTGTPPDRLLAAAKGFLREEFALRHRYAFGLHTDEPHPHVHAVVKAVSEQGCRLHIKKATVRRWRSEFARHLRERGIDANATERAVRGQIKSPKMDGIYRAEQRGTSTSTLGCVHGVAIELGRGRLRTEPGKAKLVKTRAQIEAGWRAVGDLLVEQGQIELGRHVQQFLRRIPPVRTDREQIAAELLARIEERRALHVDR